MQRFRLIIDISTSRIVYFTSNLDEELYTDEYTAIVEHYDEIPEELNLKNSYRFRYINKEFIDTGIIKDKLTNLEQNKNFLKKWINDNIKDEYHKKFNIDPYLYEVQTQKITDAKKYLNNEIKNSIWLSMVQEENHFDSLTESAEFLINYEEKFNNWLLSVECLRLTLLNEISFALTHTDLLKIKNKIIEEIKKL